MLACRYVRPVGTRRSLGLWLLPRPGSVGESGCRCGQLWRSGPITCLEGSRYGRAAGLTQVSANSPRRGWASTPPPPYVWPGRLIPPDTRNERMKRFNDPTCLFSYLTSFSFSRRNNVIQGVPSCNPGISRDNGRGMRQILTFRIRPGSRQLTASATLTDPATQ